MDTQTFNKIFENTIENLDQLINFKGEIYAKQKNRLHNFDYAAEIEEITPLVACMGMWVKQLVSLLDAIKKDHYNDPLWTQERCDEVINDLLVYLILTKAIFYRNHGWEPESKNG